MKNKTRREFLHRAGVILAGATIAPSSSAVIHSTASDAPKPLSDRKIRGLMVDAGRVPESLEYYRHVIDFCADWGLNTLHFRLADDQGSALRFATVPDLVTHKNAFAPEQLNDLTKYAQSRGVDLIPELESFGHTGYITRSPAYAHLLDVDDPRSSEFTGIIPVDPEVRQLFRRLYQNGGPTVQNGCTDCRGVVTIDTSTTPATVEKNVEYYVLGHLSKYVQTGAYRIDSNTFGSGNVEDVAFKNPDGSIAVVVLNAAASASTFTINWRGQNVTYTLPAAAVATFKWQGYPGATFGVTMGLDSQTVPPGSGQGFVVDVNRYRGDSAHVDLDLASLPSGVSGRLQPTYFFPNTSLLLLETSPGATAGTYPITVTGTQGATQRSSTGQLTVGHPETAYGGKVWPLPGLVQAENFDYGGKGVAYFNLATSNPANTTYRPQATVGVEQSSDTGGGYDVGYTAEGQWLKYTVNVAASGLYTLQARVASLGNGGYWHAEFNGRDVTGNLYTPLTNGWQTWTTMTSPVFPLQAGRQVMRIVFDGNGPSGGMGNFNWFQIAPVTPSTPFQGSPATIPGQIQMENFDNGGKGVAYFNGNTSNTGGDNYRPGETVYLEACSDTGGGVDVGSTNPGDWLNYTVNIEHAGHYTLHVRVATMVAGGVFHLAVDGRDVSGPISVPQTNGWQTWQTLTVPGIELPGGVHTLQMVMVTGGYYNTISNFNWFSLD